MWSSYQEMYLNTKNEKLIIDKRLEMVRSAHEIGIKPTARLYKCSKNVVKKWCRRYALYGIKGLKDLSRRPKHSPKRIKDEDIIKINDCVQNAKKKKKYITVNNVRRSTKIKEHSDTIDILIKHVMERKTKNILKNHQMYLGKIKLNHLCIGR